MLAPVAADPYAPSMLYSRRQAVAVYSQALLALGRDEEALAAAELAQTIHAVDIRSLVRSASALAKALAANGRPLEAEQARALASTLAHSTQQVSERQPLLPSSA
jgi:hypothetical protein